MRIRSLSIALVLALALAAVPAFAAGPAASTPTAGDPANFMLAPRTPAAATYGACVLICSYPEGGGVVYDLTKTWTQCCITQRPTCPSGTTEDRLYWDDGYNSYNC